MCIGNRWLKICCFAISLFSFRLLNSACWRGRLGIELGCCTVRRTSTGRIPGVANRAAEPRRSATGQSCKNSQCEVEGRALGVGVPGRSGRHTYSAYSDGAEEPIRNPGIDRCVVLLLRFNISKYMLCVCSAKMSNSYCFLEIYSTLLPYNRIILHLELRQFNRLSITWS